MGDGSSGFAGFGGGGSGLVVFGDGSTGFVVFGDGSTGFVVAGVSVRSSIRTSSVGASCRLADGAACVGEDWP